MTGNAKSSVRCAPGASRQYSTTSCFAGRLPLLPPTRRALRLSQRGDERAAERISLIETLRLEPLNRCANKVVSLALRGHALAGIRLARYVAQASSPAGSSGVSPHKRYGTRGETLRKLAGEDACATR